MSEFALKTELPKYLRNHQDAIEKIARTFGLDPFPTVFEILTYDQMNELAAYVDSLLAIRIGVSHGVRTAHQEPRVRPVENLRDGHQQYPCLCLSPRSNSLTDQKLVMAHVYAHVDFFKNNFCFRAPTSTLPAASPTPFEPRSLQPNRRWIDRWRTMAPACAVTWNDSGRPYRGVHRHVPVSDNLIDPLAQVHGRACGKKREKVRSHRSASPALQRLLWSRHQSDRVPRRTAQEDRTGTDRRGSSPIAPSAMCCSLCWNMLL